MIQNGVDIRTPYNFAINRGGDEWYAQGMGPEAFNQAFGDQQNGSAFVPLDIDVPEGASVGIDFNIAEYGGDFAGYLWFDQAPM